MPVSDIIGTMILGQWQRQLRDEPGLAAVTRVIPRPPGTDTVETPVRSGSYAARDYTEGSDMTHDDADASVVSITNEEDKYFSARVRDTDEDFTLVSLIDDVSLRGGQSLADAMNTSIFEALTKTFPAGQRSAGGTLSITGGWDATDRQNLVEGMADVALAAAKAGFPANESFWLTSYDVEQQLLNYLTIDEKRFGTGRLSEEAFTSRQLPLVHGYPVVVDKAVAYPATAGANRDMAYLCIRNETLGLLVTFDRRSPRIVTGAPNRWEQYVQGRVKYGAKRMSDDFVRSASFTVS